MTPTSPRSRPVLGLLLVLTTIAGLGSRAIAWLPTFLIDNAGDALWSVALFWALALVAPNGRSVALAAVALVGSFAVEFAQLIRWPWLVAIRTNRVGHLFLGSDFSWLDLARYAVGVASAAIVDASLWRGRRL